MKKSIPILIRLALPSRMSELLLGCGHSRQRRLSLPGKGTLNPWQDLVTVDNNSECKPDIVMDLDSGFWGCKSPQVKTTGLKPWMYNHYIFQEDFFSEVHAYEVLEHLGTQGDIKSFFDTFNNIYRILHDGGYLFATVPSRFGPWLWGDPGHRRAITQESISFLDQTTYEQCGFTTLSDYRSIYKSDFRIISSTDDKITHSFILQAVKPARIK